MYDLLQIGTFPTLAQNLIDAEFRCHSLAGKNVGIVGIGRIGKEIAKRLDT